MSLKSFLLDLRMRQKGVGWYGNYDSFPEALANCKGYDDPEIFKSVKEAALSVLRGEAEYERDGTLFYKKSFNLAFLAALFYSTSKITSRSLHLTDFGGALGSVYYRHKSILDNFSNIKWHVVEQEQFVQLGKDYFENDTIDFHYSLVDLHSVEPFSRDVLLFSSVLQYLPDPHEFLDQVLEMDYRFIILDSMPFVEGQQDILKVQKSKTNTYRASYPCYLLSEEKLLKRISSKYTLHFKLSSELFIYVNGRRMNYQGFLFEKLK